MEDRRRVPAGVQRAWKLRGPREIVERGTLGDSWRGRTSSGLGSNEEEAPSYGKLDFCLKGLLLNVIASVPLTTVSLKASSVKKGINPRVSF